MSLATKVFGITGGASGMGLATARLLASRGARGISILDYNEKNFDQAKKDIATSNSSTKVHTFKADVSKSAEVSTWAKAVVDEFGAFDGALNAAGVPQKSPEPGEIAILTETEDQWRRILAINLDGVYFSCREEVKVMKDLPGPKTIVNIASIAADTHRGAVYAYCTSKAAVKYFTRSLAKELTPLGIRVNGIQPGPIETPMLKHFMPKNVDVNPMAGMETGTADDVAHTAAWLLSEDSKNVAGVHVVVGSGMP
ncbi:Enoyl-(Acyl carrier protein) reductase-like protein 5 [Elsinoe fawcettii]|nr:Enoyl-(Acyl carrier protein) reductase-like protein 5 [Elsinoe fawcettii]